MNRRTVCFLCLLASAYATVTRGEPDGYIDQRLDPKYEKALLTNTVLMQSGGVDTVVLEDGSEVLIGVGQVALAPDASPADTLNSRQVAELKAAATVSQFLKTDLAMVSELIKQQTVVHAEEGEGEFESRVRRVEKFLNTHIKARSQLRARMKQVGSWRSADGQYLYVAMVVAPLE